MERSLLTVEWTGWDDSWSHEVSGNYSEVRELLRNAIACNGPPPLVEIYDKSSGQSFGLGVGRDFSVITYQDSLDPPYFISLGNSGAEGVEWFCFGNERTEYLRSNIITNDAAMNALRQFLKKRKRPDNIDWERL